MKRLTVRAEELLPGDRILIPETVVHGVTPEKTQIRIVTEAGYPVMYRRGALVGIMR